MESTETNRHSKVRSEERGCGRKDTEDRIDRRELGQGAWQEGQKTGRGERERGHGQTEEDRGCGHREEDRGRGHREDGHGRRADRTDQIFLH